MKLELKTLTFKQLDLNLSVLQHSYCSFGRSTDVLSKYIENEFGKNSGEMKELNKGIQDIEESYRSIMSPIEMEIENR